MKKIIELKKGDTAYKIDSLHNIHKVKVKNIENVTRENGTVFLRITFSDDETILIRMEKDMEHKSFVNLNAFSPTVYTTTKNSAKEIVSEYYDERISKIDKEIENLSKEREQWISIKKKRLTT